MKFSALNVGLLTNVLDSLPDGILIVSEGRRVVYTNNRFREMWNIPMHCNLDDEGQAIMEHAIAQIADPERFLQVVEMLHNTDEEYEDEIQLRDGRSFKRRSGAFKDSTLGQSRIWIFTDVTAILHSKIDLLTGLLNRNDFERQFSSLCVDATPQTMIGVALFDIDHFKKFNDTYGHLAGDEVIRNIGAIIRSHLQSQADIAYRVGGEEFFIQCSGRSKQEVTQLFDSIRCSVEALAIPHATNPPFNRVSISGGFSICTKPRPPEFIYQVIDRALYQSKASGRNQITFAELGMVQNAETEDTVS